jgi:hypothetical protein
VAAKHEKEAICIKISEQRKKAVVSNKVPN